MAARHISDWEQAKRQYPSTQELTERDWADFFTQRPDVLHAVLGDIYVVTKADEAKQRGQGRDGRRPKHVNGSLTELYEMITPRYHTGSFAEAICELKGAMSLRAFSAKVPIDHRELSRMMRGAARPSPYWMERIAEAYKVNPAYFADWRIEFVSTALATAFRRQPNLSIRAVKLLRTGRAR